MVSCHCIGRRFGHIRDLHSLVDLDISVSHARDNQNEPGSLGLGYETSRAAGRTSLEWSVRTWR